MSLPLCAFLAINHHLLTVFADSSSVRGGAPSDLIDLNQHGHENEKSIFTGEDDHLDLTSPLQHKVLDGKLFDDGLFKQTTLVAAGTIGLLKTFNLDAIVLNPKHCERKCIGRNN